MSNLNRKLQGTLTVLFVGLALSTVTGCSGGEGAADDYAAEFDDPGLDDPGLDVPGLDAADVAPPDDGELDSIYSATATKGSSAPAVIAAANSQVGVPYSWGGGNTTGPTYGIGKGAHTKGFDCSGLMQYAFYRGTPGHTNIGDNTKPQLAAGKRVSASQRQPGDLVFYGPTQAGATPTHVALYVGKNAKTGVEYMIEAPHTGANVRWTKLRLSGGQFVRVL